MIIILLALMLGVAIGVLWLATRSPNHWLRLVCALLVACAGFWGGLRFNSYSRRAIAESHAIWLARYWQNGASIDVLCAAINREQSQKILKEEWNLGNEEELIIGPVINGKIVFIEKNKAVLWRDAK